MPARVVTCPTKWSHSALRRQLPSHGINPEHPYIRLPQSKHQPYTAASCSPPTTPRPTRAPRSGLGISLVDLVENVNAVGKIAATREGMVENGSGGILTRSGQVSGIYARYNIYDRAHGRVKCPRQKMVWGCSTISLEREYGAAEKISRPSARHCPRRSQHDLFLSWRGVDGGQRHVGSDCLHCDGGFDLVAGFDERMRRSSV
jgi:hypothetical protein